MNRAGAAAAGPAPALRRRLACLLYEGVLLFGVVFASALAYALLTGQRHALQGRLGLTILALVLVPGLYLVWHWSRTGQTLPMQTWHIRLVTASGGRVSPTRAAARYLASWIWFLPALLAMHATGIRSGLALAAALVAGIVGYALLALLHPQRQFWHDALCGTRLVDTQAQA